MPIGITVLSPSTPDCVSINSDLEGTFETSDKWIGSRTAIRDRDLAAKEEFASDMGVRAINNLHEPFVKFGPNTVLTVLVERLMPGARIAENLAAFLA